MPRPATGQVVCDERRKTPVFALRFRAYGQREYLTLGTAEDGWTHAKAEMELQNVLADVRRGIWRPPHPEPAPVAPADPSFHEFASEWFDARRGELRSSTIADYSWRLSNHLLPFFARHRLSQITVREVDRYRQAKVREGELSAESINKTLMLLAAVLEQARRVRADRAQPGGRQAPAAAHEQAAALATWIWPRRSLRCWTPPASSTPRRRRVIPEIGTSTAARCWRRSRSPACDSGSYWRCAGAMSTSPLGGCGSPTPRPTRACATFTYCRSCAMSCSRSRRAAAREAEALVFADHHGQADRRQQPAPPGARPGDRARECAADRGSGQPPLPADLTPHSLRRTFASVLYALGSTPPVVMAEMGHTDPKLALAIYAQAMGRDEGQLRGAARARAGRRLGSGWAARGDLSSGRLRRRAWRLLRKQRIAGLSRWARLGLNQRPLACEASALPLSYAPWRGKFYAEPAARALEPDNLLGADVAGDSAKVDEQR